MNFLRRLVRRLRGVRATIRGLDPAPLPEMVVDPRLPVDTLTSRAQASGTASARAQMYDGWSFGRPSDPESDRFEPSFVRQLRRERQAAVASIRALQSIASSRVSHVTRWRDENESMMDSAKVRMGGIAAREAQQDAARIRASQARAGVDVTAEVPPPEVPDERVWEGETSVLGFWWRMLIVIGLVLAELPAHFVVYDYFLGGSSTWNGRAGFLSLSTSAVLVLVPFVAGLLVRARQATGGSRLVRLIVPVVAVLWAYPVVIMGLVLADRFDRGDNNTSRLEQLNLTPLTISIMFVTLLAIIGAMAYLLGLARNHPFQQAYLRSRRRRDRLDTMRRELLDRINGAYRDPDTQSPDETDNDERAVIEAYGAAEEAYFDALARGVGNPAFTEAIERRRGLRAQPATAAPPSVPTPVEDPSATTEPGRSEDSPAGFSSDDSADILADPNPDPDPDAGPDPAPDPAPGLGAAFEPGPGAATAGDVLVVPTLLDDPDVPEPTVLDREEADSK